MINLFKKLNQRSKIREDLIKYLTNISSYTLENIKFQSSILAQLTKSTNELTRTTNVSEIIFLEFNIS